MPKFKKLDRVIRGDDAAEPFAYVHPRPNCSVGGRGVRRVWTRAELHDIRQEEHDSYGGIAGGDDEFCHVQESVRIAMESALG